MTKASLYSIALGAVLALAAPAAAQTSCSTAGCSLTNTVSATVPTVISLTISTAATALTNPVTADFDNPAGVTDAGPTVTSTANTNYHVTIAAAAANWTAPGGVTKVAGDLSWSTGGAYTALSTTAANVVPLLSRGTVTTNMSYNTLWHSATDDAGAYSLGVVYTILTP